MSEAAAEIGRLLSERIGLDPSTIGPSLMSAAILARMNASGTADPSAYVRLVRGSEREFGELVELVVVSESWFFRDRRPFEYLAAVATTRWLLHPERPIVRALSVPCAAGEEPYSIAMSLLDAGFPPERIQIDAVDLSLRALDLAARAVYGRNAFREQGLTFRDRYFRPVGSTFALDPSVRKLVRFRHLNLLDDQFLGDAEPYQVIFCRNLLIYLERRARRHALDVFHRLIASDGTLFIGHAEAAPNLDPRFRQVDEPGTFCYERQLTPLPPPAPVVRPPAPAVRAVRPVAPAPAAPAAKAAVKASPAPTSRSLLDQAAELANAKRHAEAIELCERAIRQAGPKPEAYHLLGLIHQSSGALDQAEAALGKAVYLDPRHDEALFALSLLADRRGRSGEAAAFRRRAERARRAKETS
jgi:chemotaxis protein methyltransferase WspC